MSFEFGHPAPLDRPRQTLDQAAEKPGHILVQGQPMKIDDAADALGMPTPQQLVEDPNPAQAIEAMTPQQAQMMVQMLATERAQLQQGSVDIKLSEDPEAPASAELRAVDGQRQKLDHLTQQVQARADLAPQPDLKEAGFGALFFAPIQEMIEAARQTLMAWRMSVRCAMKAINPPGSTAS